ncbi:MAG: hypothetical protein R3C15_14070 [Thermoleophilia bacterium]
MRSALGLALVALVALAAGCGGSGEEEPAVAPVEPEQALLALDDVGPGYVVGDDSACGPLGLEGASDALVGLVRSLPAPPPACARVFEQRYVAPEEGETATEAQEDAPPLVWSVSLVLPGADEAERALALAPDLVAQLTGLALAPVEDTVRVGDASVVLAGDDVLVAGTGGHDGRAIVWRDEEVVGAVVAAGLSPEDDETAAIALALAQRTRLAVPEPGPTVTDDLEVPLGDPALGVDVWWLGRAVDLGTGAPELRLVQVNAPLGPGNGPGNRAQLDYGASSGAPALVLQLWQPEAWGAFQETPLGRLVVSPPCGSVGQVDVGGRAVTLYAAPEAVGPAWPDIAARGPAPTCPSGEPDVFWAAVELDGVVVTLDVPLCLSCLGTRPEPYDTREALLAAVERLEPYPGPAE